MGFHFACTACGSPAVKLPEHLTHAAVVSCSACAHPITTWGEFKRRTTQMLLAEYGSDPDTLERISSDPLAHAANKPISSF